MKKSIIIILSLLLSFSLIGQEEKKNAFTLSWGMGNIMRQHITVSPFIHKNWSPQNMAFSYERSNKLDQLFELKFSFYDPSIVDPYEFNSFYNGLELGLKHSFSLIDLNYALGKKLVNHGKFDLVIGAKSRNFIYASDYNFGPSGPSPMFISFGLDAWTSANYKINEKHNFKAKLSFPLFAHIYRAPYLSQDDEFFENLYSHNGLKEFSNRVEDGQLQSWGNSQRIDLKINYAYTLNQKWDFVVSYLFSMNLNQNPTRFTQIENVFYVGVKFKF